MRYERAPASSWFLLLLLAWMCTADSAHAQPVSRGRREVGGFVGAINFREAVGEKPVALGLRFGYGLTNQLAIEAQVTNCPKNGGGNFGQFLVVAGPRLGVWIGPLSVGGKLHFGAIHFGGKGFRAQNPDVRTRPVLNPGAVVELALSPAVGIRIDAGDVIVPFGSAVIRSPLPPVAAQYGTTHNREGSFGFVVRF